MDECGKAYESEYNGIKVDEKGWHWIEEDKILCKLIDVNESGWNWMIVDERVWKWLEIHKSQWKWIEVNEIG